MPKRKKKADIGYLILAVAGIALFMALGGFRSCPGGSASKRPARYSLQFSPDFQPALSFRDDLGLSVVVAVDVSGSMGDKPATGPQTAKYVQASGALTEVLKVLEGLVGPQKEGGLLVKLSLISFSDQVRVLLPTTVLNRETLRALEAYASTPDNFRPGGATAIGAAVEKGTEILAQSGTIMRSLIVISDGENTSGIEPESVLEAVYTDRNTASTAEVAVTTSSTLVSFIGFDIDAARFSGLAERGARVTGASDQEELVSELRGLLEADITKLESAGPGGP